MSENTNERWYCNRWNWTVCIVVLAIYGYALFGFNVHQWFYNNYWRNPHSIFASEYSVLLIYFFEYAVWVMGIATAVAAALIRRECYWKWMVVLGWLLIFLQTAENAGKIPDLKLKEIPDGLMVWSLLGWPMIGAMSALVLQLRKMATRIEK